METFSSKGGVRFNLWGMVRPLTDSDFWLFAEGRHDRLYEILGCHLESEVATFRVWAPAAAEVSVVGDFNSWQPGKNPLIRIDGGLWEGKVAGAVEGNRYKYHIVSQIWGYTVDKADPFGFRSEVAPGTASVIWPLDHTWTDQNWMNARKRIDPRRRPFSIYEVHLGSWRRPAGYRESAEPLRDYLLDMGFTHVEFLPLMEHPYYPSWGYQTTGYTAATSRYGSPQDLMGLIDTLHQAGVGVILDWVPSHFPTDEHGLGYFDGTYLYEHADPRQGYHPDWKSLIFNYDRGEVRSFLISTGHFWFDRYHADGLRVDAVASMLYLDYSRKEGDWVPNAWGGRENTGAIHFLRDLNTSVYARFPGVETIAEESTAWPLVSHPVAVGGLGFGFKWDMGWMNDTLRYVGLDHFFRSHVDNHRLLTFRGIYAHSENYVLPLSHDEVVHGKGSLLGKQAGDMWQRFAGLRCLLAYQWSLPGKKLLFMGGELAQPWEWNHDGDLAWQYLEYPEHRGVQDWVRLLNRLHQEEPSLHVGDHSPDGMSWLDADNVSSSVLALLRWSPNGRSLVVVFNFTPVPRPRYRIGAPSGGTWEVLGNSDDPEFGGSGFWPERKVAAEPAAHGSWDHSLTFDLPPMACVFLAPA